jgi:hypothetical protein
MARIQIISKQYIFDDENNEQNIVREGINENLIAAINLAITNIHSFSGIYLICVNEFDYQDNESLEIRNLIKSACDKVHMEYNDDYMTNYDDECTFTNKNIIYIYNSDIIDLVEEEGINEDNHLICFDMGLCNLREFINKVMYKIKNFEIYKREDNYYLCDEKVYTIRNFTVDELANELKKKL